MYQNTPFQVKIHFVFWGHFVFWRGYGPSPNPFPAGSGTPTPRSHQAFWIHHTSQNSSQIYGTGRAVRGTDVSWLRLFVQLPADIHDETLRLMMTTNPGAVDQLITSRSQLTRMSVWSHYSSHRQMS